MAGMACRRPEPEPGGTRCEQWPYFGVSRSAICRRLAIRYHAQAIR